MMSKVDYIVELYRQIKDWDYGIVYRDKKILNPSDDDYWNKYITLTPKLFEIYKCGTCWDYVAYQHKKLLDNHVVHNSFYTESGNGESHSYTICTVDKKHYYIEASDKRFSGIYVFDKLDNALSYANIKAATEWTSKRVATYKYDPDKSALRSTNCARFMEYFHYQKPFMVSNKECEPIEILH